MAKKLKKSKSDAVIFGVCSGFANYFDISVVLIRIIWILLFLLAGFGLLAYLICAIVMPSK